MQGVDFFFGNRAHALKFIAFVQSVVPMRYRSDKQLVSHNEHSATYNYKYTFSVEIVPICRVSHSLNLANSDAACLCTGKGQRVRDRKHQWSLAVIAGTTLPGLMWHLFGCLSSLAEHACHC